jgi:hypothetical protein
MNIQWVKAASVRALKTMAQTALGVTSVGITMYDINWAYTFSVSLVAGILSVLTSVAGLPEVDNPSQK